MPLEWITHAALPELTAAFCRKLKTVLTEPGDAAVALTGGRSAGAFYDAWAASGVDPRWQFYWSDERLVEPNDPDSNVKLGRERLFGPSKVAEEHIHAPRTALAGEKCATDYATSIRLAVPAGEGATPAFPLIILGMGADGHTGSLFPGRNPYEEQEKLVRAVAATPAHPHARITFTPQLINAAQQVWFLVTGAAKAWAVEQLAERKLAIEQFPALAVDPQRTKITIFADEGSTGGRDYS
ncbi:MAG: 6-phosphogluconolactonase [Acidobacteria bacterium]|nr:MAG: 6-phosphogluconolactonase [Acidobacteriota bacterium]